MLLETNPPKGKRTKCYNVFNNVTLKTNLLTLILILHLCSKMHEIGLFLSCTFWQARKEKENPID